MKRTLGTEVDLGARYPWRLLFSLYLFKHVDLFKMLRSNGATAFLSLTYGGFVFIRYVMTAARWAGYLDVIAILFYYPTASHHPNSCTLTSAPTLQSISN